MADVKIVVGLDGSEASGRVIDFATSLAHQIGECEIIACYVIEWSPFAFQSAEENERRHRRREDEIATARERVIDPAVAALTNAGVKVQGKVAHGDVADIIERLAVKNDARQIVIGRVGTRGVVQRIFGGVSGRLIVQSPVPVTIVP